MNLTYKELLIQLKGLTENELNQNVTISLDLSQETVPIKDFVQIKDDDFLSDVLDDGHWVLTADF